MSVPPFLSIVTLGVRDLPRSVAFYEALGWVKASSSMDEIVWFGLSGAWLGLFAHAELAADADLDAGPLSGPPPESAPAPEYRGMTLAMNLTSDDAVLAAYDAAIAAGGTPVKAPVKAVFDGLSGYWADPDGHLWEVAHNPFFPVNDDGTITIP